MKQVDRQKTREDDGHLVKNGSQGSTGAASLDTLDSLVRSFLATRRIADAWHLFFMDNDGQLISTHVYEQDRAERIAAKWRETYKDDPTFHVMVVGPNAEAHGRRSRTVQPLVGDSGDPS